MNTIWRRSTWLAAGLAVLVACGGADSPPAAAGTPPAAAPPVPPRLEAFATGLDTPWGMAFLPDGSMLVTERGGRMRRVSADGKTVSAPLAGLPPVAAAGQGGLLDVVIDPDFATDPWIYWSYAEPGSGAEAGLRGTAVARGRLVGDSLQDVQLVFRQSPKYSSGQHFGSRLVFDRDKQLFVTLGDRGQDSPSSPGTMHAQNPGSGLGKVFRLQRDGRPAAGNPIIAGGLPGLWSVGHRNVQGAALHPQTGELWLTEHGPQGGDELNRVLPGRNYGWPLRSYGCPYGSLPFGDGCRVGGGVHAPAYEEPLSIWVPTSVAPSGMAFYTASRHPQWTGSLFVGALAGRSLWRLTLTGNAVTARESLFDSLGERIRDVRQGPDGRLYVLTDSPSGRILRSEP